MARAIWTGALSFGLVTVPVGMYSATENHTTHFNQIQRGTSDRVRIRRVNERTGEEVAYKDIVKGYDLGDEQYVVIEPEELDQITPGRSRVIEVAAFVELAAVDPVSAVDPVWAARSSRAGSSISSRRMGSSARCCSDLNNLCVSSNNRAFSSAFPSDAAMVESNRTSLSEYAFSRS